MSDRRAVALVLLSAAGFGSSAVFARAAYASGVNPSTMLALRFVMAAMLLLPLMWLGGWRLPRGRLLAGYVLMGLMYTAQSQGYFNALLYASSGLCAMLLYAYPVLVTILALALGWEKLDRRMLVLMLLAIAGMAVTLGGKLQGQPIGIALALMAAGVYAVYILFGNSLSKSAVIVHPLAACVVILGTAGLANSAIAVWQGVSLPGTATGWLAVAAIALFSTAIAIAAFFAGVAQIGAARASIISTFEPVITMAFGVGMLGEKVSGTQLLGGAMVLAAVVMLANKPKPKPAAKASAMPGVQASA